jgi:hypothetical protein
MASAWGTIKAPAGNRAFEVRNAMSELTLRHPEEKNQKEKTEKEGGVESVAVPSCTLGQVRYRTWFALKLYAKTIA